MSNSNHFVGRGLVIWRVVVALLCITSVNAVADEWDPPWSQPIVKGIAFTVPGVDNAPDFHGDVNNPDLVVFFAGNQYMLVNELLAAFRKMHPEYSRVFAETLPPGILSRQIEQGALVMGNMRIEVHPDVFTAGRGRIHKLAARGWFNTMADYARNRLALITYKDNPLHIMGWQDLARPGVRLCMPNPKTEGIAAHAIIPALVQAGGKNLEDAIYVFKVKQGETKLTRIHHRQTPLAVMRKQCDAGAVWFTEAWFHSHIKHHPVSMVEIPDHQNHEVTYTAGVMKNAPHAKAARAFLRFLTGKKGQAIYRHYGFLPVKKAKS